MTEQITQLAVLRFAEGWRLVDRNHRWGRFQYRVDAEEAALRLAAKIVERGDKVQLLIQERDGELRAFRWPDQSWSSTS